MSLMIKEGEARGVCVQPVYAVSEDASATILDLAATLGVDYIILGSSQRRTLADLLRGSVATQIAQNLPEIDSVDDLRIGPYRTYTDHIGPIRCANRPKS